MKRIRFITLHPAGVNADLTKDEGQIPYTLCTTQNVDATIVTCHIDKNANLDCVAGLNVKHFPFIINNALTGVIYILLNAKKIDWLNIYFAGRQALYWTKLYKLLNPNGRVYLKLDMNFRSCDLYDNSETERNIFKKNTKEVDIVSVESEKIKNRIQKYSDKEILLIRNGFAKLNFKPNIFQKRENVFLTVGRLGTMQKATDILLQAFAKSSNKHNWNLKLIGKVEEDFKPYIHNFFEKNPNLKTRIIFTGEIKNRELLYSEYCHAKVFVLPSRWESFGISGAEALSCGCHLILSNTIPPAKEMTNNEKYGKIIEADNIDVLASEMTMATQQEYTQEQIEELSNYAFSLFSWESICKKLYYAMTDIEEKNRL